VRLFLDGVISATSNPITWSLNQNVPLIFGGHASTSSSINRYFNGWLDELALFRGTLDSNELANLARRSVATIGGLSASSTVNVTVLSPLQAWRQQFFGTTANSGTAADTADPDGDGVTNLLEYALGTAPDSAASAFPDLELQPLTRRCHLRHRGWFRSLDMGTRCHQPRCGRSISDGDRQL